VVVSALSLFAAIACLGSPDQCLNPQPDLPSCRATDAPAGGRTGAAGAANPSLGGAPGAGGSGSPIVDNDSGLPNGAAGSSSEYAGAGGDSAGEPGGDASAGAAGEGAAAGAAGALGGLLEGP